MPEKILITMDDIEAAVRLNAAFEGAGFNTSMVAQVDDYRTALKKENPDLVLLTGALHEPPARQLRAAPPQPGDGSAAQSVAHGLR